MIRQAFILNLYQECSFEKGSTTNVTRWWKITDKSNIKEFFLIENY